MYDRKHIPKGAHGPFHLAHCGTLSDTAFSWSSAIYSNSVSLRPFRSAAYLVKVLTLRRRM